MNTDTSVLLYNTVSAAPTTRPGILLECLLAYYIGMIIECSYLSSFYFSYFGETELKLETFYNLSIAERRKALWS